jgi:hypothetical protein
LEPLRSETEITVLVVDEDVEEVKVVVVVLLKTLADLISAPSLTR